MNEHPVRIVAPLVQAILNGKKSQLRAPIERPLQHPGWTSYVYYGPHPNNPNARSEAIECGADYPDDTTDCVPCPYGQVGDRLWIQEPWRVLIDHDALEAGEIPIDARVEYADSLPTVAGRWRSSSLMPRWASRAVLEVLWIDVGRIQDMTEVDAIDCGALTLPNRAGYALEVAATPAGTRPPLGDSPRQRFARFWSTTQDRGRFEWECNPWVWICGIQRVEEPGNGR